MKKFISAFLTAALLFTTLLPATFAAESWSVNTDISGADLKVGLMGDSHVTENTSIQSWFKEALSAQKAVSGDTLDGLALTGDIIYQNDTTNVLMDRYDPVMAALENEGYGLTEGKTPFVFAMGNHEYPQNGNSPENVLQAARDLFVEKTGQQLNVNKVINGFHFIAASPQSYNLTLGNETENWLKTQIDAAIAEDPNKPVFVILHGPIQNTVFDLSSANRYSADFAEYIKAKPQVVNLTAHEHAAAQLPQNIMQIQNGFTVFQTPLTGGGYLWEYGCASTGNIGSVHQSCVLTVKDNIVKIYKLDLVTKELIGEPWEINIPELVKGNNDAYLYSADKRENSNKPAFPAEASVTATAKSNNITLTYPNTATNEATGSQQDGFVRAYKVEIAKEDGTAVTSSIYQADFYLPESQRVSKYTRTIGGLAFNTKFNVNIYPMSPLGVFGDPITATCKTEEAKLPENAVRYEFEDYYPIANVIKECEFSSKGKLVASNNGGMLTPTVVPRDTDASFSFEIDVAVGGEYGVEYTFGYHSNNTANVGQVTLSIDGTEIGKNDGSYIEDISVGSTYPWKYIPMKIYRKSATLTAGKHTVNVKIDVPTTNTEQPNIFAIDYLQLVPKTVLVTSEKAATIEFETYASDYSSSPTSVITDGQASSGSYVYFDTDTRTDPITLSIPVSVDEAGNYGFEYVASSGLSATSIYLDDRDEPFWTVAGGSAIDSGRAENGNWPYFNQKWHQAYRYNFKADLPAGEHTIKISLATRPAEPGVRDVCISMDYLKITPPVNAVIGKSKAASKIEFEDYAGNLSIAQTDGTTWNPRPATSSGCSNGQYLYIDTVDGKASNEYEVLPIPVTIQNAGFYDMEYIEGNGISAMKIFLDSTDGICLSSGVTTELDSSKNEAGKYAHFESGWCVAANRSKTVYLPAGTHTLMCQLQWRENEKDFASYLDYIEFTPTDGLTIENGTATAGIVLDSPVSGKAILALYDENKLVTTNAVDVTDASFITIDAAVSKTITHAKVFVWSDLTNFIPQTETKTLTVQ